MDIGTYNVVWKGVDNKGVDIYYSIVEDEVLPFLQQVSDEVVF